MADRQIEGLIEQARVAVAAALDVMTPAAWAAAGLAWDRVVRVGARHRRACQDVAITYNGSPEERRLAADVVAVFHRPRE